MSNIPKAFQIKNEADLREFAKEQLTIGKVRKFKLRKMISGNFFQDGECFVYFFKLHKILTKEEFEKMVKIQREFVIK